MLSGVNKICAECKGECKQWKQVKLVYCPSYEPISSRDSNSLPFPHRKKKEI